MRSPSRQARTVTAGPRSVDARRRRARQPRPRPPSRRSGRGRARRARPGAGGPASAARVKRSVPYSATARRPPPRSSDFVPRCPERQDLARLARAEHAAGAPRPASAAPAAGARAGARAARRGDTAGPPPSSLERVGHGGVQHLGLVAQLARGLGDRPLGRRRQLAQRVEHVVPHAGAREAAVGVRGVLAPLEPARAQVVAHLLARHARAAAAPAARAAAPCRAARASRARRPAGRAPSPPGRRRCARRRSRPSASCSASA